MRVTAESAGKHTYNRGMASPQPYRLDIPQSALDDLRQRLQNARLPDHIPGAGWDMGTEPSYLQVSVRPLHHHYELPTLITMQT